MDPRQNSFLPQNGILFNLKTESCFAPLFAKDQKSTETFHMSLVSDCQHSNFCGHFSSEKCSMSTVY